jgi:integrative and conjugative element protein (TIGR02256 family)
MDDRYQLNEKEYVQLSNDALEVFRIGVRTTEKESGGILLGSVFPRSHVLVEMATRPGFLDKAGRYFFERSRPRAQTIVNRRWKKSAGQSIYLGEWHTHPVADPVPSSRDRTMIRNMFHQTKMEIDFLLLIIVGTRSLWIGIENGESVRELLGYTGRTSNGETARSVDVSLFEKGA